MSLRVYTLKLRSSGNKVLALRNTLISLGYQISEGEKNHQEFGESTRKAITDFQQKMKLTTGYGEVDFEIAMALRIAWKTLCQKNRNLSI